MEILWEDRFLLGVEKIDKQHKGLFTVARRVLNILDENREDKEKQRFACMEGLQFFKASLVEHFRDEEEYMRSINYEHYQEHKHKHDLTLQRVLPTLERDLMTSNFSREAIEKLIGFILVELIAHVVTYDVAIVGSGPLIMPRERLDVSVVSFATAASDILEDTFGNAIKVTMIDGDYIGGEIEDGVYQKSIYSYGKDKQVEFYLEIDKELLFQGCAMILGKKRTKVDLVIKSLMSELSNIIGVRLAARFIPPSEDYEQIDNRLIRYEELMEKLDQGLPDISTLFETQFGKFSLRVYKSA